MLYIVMYGVIVIFLCHSCLIWMRPLLKPRRRLRGRLIGSLKWLTAQHREDRVSSSSLPSEEVLLLQLGEHDDRLPVFGEASAPTVPLYGTGPDSRQTLGSNLHSSAQQSSRQSSLLAFGSVLGANNTLEMDAYEDLSGNAVIHRGMSSINRSVSSPVFVTTDGGGALLGSPGGVIAQFSQEASIGCFPDREHAGDIPPRGSPPSSQHQSPKLEEQGFLVEKSIRDLHCVAIVYTFRPL